MEVLICVTMIESKLKDCTAPIGGTIFAMSETRLVLHTVVITDSVATEGSGTEGRAKPLCSENLQSSTLVL